jgi:arginine/lysine/ornithine decarboxylase
MAKTLELQFATEMGGTARISIDNPKEPIDTVAVKDSMNQIIAAGVFFSPTGILVTVKGVRVVERNVTDYEIV